MQVKIGTHKTTVERWRNNLGHYTTAVKYHNTTVVEFNEDTIHLNTDGYFTTTTKNG